MGILFIVQVTVWCRPKHKHSDNASRHGISNVTVCANRLLTDA